MGSPIILWLRRDLRLGDHPAMTAAAESGRPVIPVFLLDEVMESLGACPKWRFGLAARHFSATLDGIGSKLIFRRGRALDVLQDIVKETGAGAVWWSRAYDPDQIARDTEVKSALKEAGIEARSFAGHVLFEPWTVETGSGGFYKVYSPFWRAVRDRDVGPPLKAVSALRSPETWPDSDDPSDWALEEAMNRGADVVRPHLNVGEEAARGRLGAFIGQGIEDYDRLRDRPGVHGTSRLSENLTYGEISIRSCWQAGWTALHDGKSGAERFLKELVWRDFAYHLAYHTPRIMTDNWREEWDGFPWNSDPSRPEVTAWKQGRTGLRFVDAAMREMFVTGHMHNRARMIVASVLTKYALAHWKVGLDWFAECLADWDPAANAMGWQWVAGSGPDAAPYFRVFNPETQLEKFDPEGDYTRTWIAEGAARPTKTALSYFDAVPRSWSLSPDDAYPEPFMDPKDGRTRALSAYERWKSEAG